MTQNTAPATRNNTWPYWAGWLVAALIAWTQPPGLIAADTKLDLAHRPGAFLLQATNIYTDNFTLGQLQNQAYGYLFPHGLFFLLLEPLPEWVVQRLWWTLILALSYTGTLLLLRCTGIGQAYPLMQILGAAAYALSPRILTTLTAISSEAWPVMLVPWTLWPLCATKIRKHHVAASIVAVGMMGAVNASATLAACVPAAILLLWRREWRNGLWWLLGCAAVSAWWIGPLLLLGRYSPPFTDYIESAYVTTRWLNLAEILRGTTSWTPFVETERQAGHLLVAEPVLVAATLAVAACGLIGLVKAPHRALWLSMLAVGLLVLLGAAHVTPLLDGALSAFRNVHKFDPLVRLPLAVGIAALQPPRRAAYAPLVLVLLAATSPAWTMRLLPEGAYRELDDDWVAASNYINEHAAGTRTLIWPGSSFARYDWGWTRDEPAQVLLDTPWAIRDAIPLIHPETIRYLDAVNQRPTNANLERLGIGAVINRDPSKRLSLPGQRERFGELEVTLLSPTRNLWLSDTNVPKVKGGGEALANLGPGAYQLDDQQPDIVTDTPLLTARNYGRIDHATSDPLSNPQEQPKVKNPHIDYDSTLPSIAVTEEGGHVRVSGSAADPTNLGGARPERGVAAALDDDPSTAWFPPPGNSDGEWLELQPASSVKQAKLHLRTRGDINEVTISNGDASITRVITPNKDHYINVPGGTANTVRITLGPSAKATGIATAQIEGAPIRRIIDLGEIPTSAKQIVLSNKELPHRFTLLRPMTLRTTRDQVLELPVGTHEFNEPITLTEDGFNPDGATLQATGTDIQPATHERILHTNRTYNAGLQATVGGTPVSAISSGAMQQAFLIPAGVSGEFEMTHEAQPVYRLMLVGGGALALLTHTRALWLVGRRRGEPWCAMNLNRPSRIRFWVLGYTWFTPARTIASTMLVATMLMARAPWPSPSYTGEWLMCAVALLALYASPRG